MKTTLAALLILMPFISYSQPGILSPPTQNILSDLNYLLTLSVWIL